jgi:hypothetical protein
MTREALCAKTLERCPTAEACLEANHCAKWDDITEDLPSDWLSPNWKTVTRVHDWRGYIPVALRRRWIHLSCETRIVAACLAEQQASAEEWD